MKIYQPVPQSNHWPYKEHAAFYTTAGNSDKIIEVIKSIDPEEFPHALDKNGNFIIPIHETMTTRYGMPIMGKRSHTEYYGKFELDLDKFYKKCDSLDIPVYVEIEFKCFDS